MSEKKPVVVMTATGRAKEFAAGSTIREVLESIRGEYMRAGSGWDRPTRLFIGGECVVSDKLADIAWDYGEFYDKKCDEMDAALDAWIKQRVGGQPESEAA
jgi:hypothetical protein